MDLLSNVFSHMKSFYSSSSQSFPFPSSLSSSPSQVPLSPKINLPHQSPQESKQQMPIPLKFLSGGCAGTFTIWLVHPFDTIKTRIQLRGQNGIKKVSSLSVAKDIYINQGGIRAFFIGLDSSMMRQSLSSTIRIGIFFSLSGLIKKLKKSQQNPQLSIIQKIACSITSGSVSAFFATPGDVCLVRMQADKTFPPQQRRNYKNVFDALWRIPRQQGVRSLWKGAVPTISRAIALNIGMLVSYEQAKERISKLFGQGHVTQNQIVYLASAVSGVFASVFSLPFDNIKVKLQKMKQLPNGKMPYSGVFDCLFKSYRINGVRGLFAGLPTYYFRIAPHVMTTFLVYEKMQSFFGY